MKVAVCQLNSRDDRAANLSEARRLLRQAADAGADFAVLPELVDYLGRRRGEPAAETVDGEFGQFFSDVARELNLWVLAGSFRERAFDGERAHNTSLLFDRSGVRVAAYRKVHLYDVEISGKVSYAESKTIAPGEELVVADVEGVPVGLSICYDLRFPELYRALVTGGARLVIVPAAFTLHTGKDHWHTLLRARAIENQLYVLAPGQVGRSHGDRACWGKSSIFDPWGALLAEAPDRECVVVAEIDLAWQDKVRRELPCLSHRRL